MFNCCSTTQEYRFNAVAAALSRIDVEKAHSFSASDRAAVALAMSSSAGGFAAVDAHIRSALRGWFEQQALRLVKERRQLLGDAHMSTAQTKKALAALHGLHAAPHGDGIVTAAEFVGGGD